MATRSSVLAWRIPGTGGPGGLPSMGSHRVGHEKWLSSNLLIDYFHISHWRFWLQSPKSECYGEEKHKTFLLSMVEYHPFQIRYSPELIVLCLSNPLPLRYAESSPWLWIKSKVGSIPGLERPPEEVNGNPLQYSCLGNPMDRSDWWLHSVGWQRVRHNWAQHSIQP